jgi:cobalt-zinc-cadmium resistance protein CzcA
VERFLARLIRQRLLVIVSFLFVSLLGLLSFLELPIDAFPDLTNNQVQILSETPGMAPLEAEQLVTIPIEASMNGLPDVQQIRSISRFGLSVVTVVFHDRVDLYRARQLVNERLQSSRERLPEGVRTELGPITTGMGEIYQYVVRGEGLSPTELKTLHDWEIKYRLRGVPGVYEVNTWGGFTREIVVTVRPDALRAMGLTLQEVCDALASNNENFSGGILAQGPEQIVVRGLGRFTSLEDIGKVLIQRRGGLPIPLFQVADVTEGQAFRQGAVTQDGRGEVVTGLVMMLKGENSRNVIERVQRKIRDIGRSLPEGVTLEPFYDQSRLVAQTLETVQTNLLEGGMLVIGVLLMMLGDLRAALIVALVIPVSLLFSFIGMKGLGITANIISLGALDFGMIVDGAIVMVENTVSRLSQRSGMPVDRLAAVQASVREMARPVFFGVLIIALVYLPILSLEGLEYKLFSPMVLTVCFALLGSLLAALTLVPVLCSLLLRPGMKEHDPWLLRKVRPGYRRLLDAALRQPRRTVWMATLCFVLTMATVPFLGSEFVPELDEGDLIVEVRNLPSISLTEATRVTTQIESLLRVRPEVETVVSKTGRPDLATDPMSVYQSDVYVILKPREQWPAGASKDALVDWMSERLAQAVPGAAFNFTQPIAMRVDELVSGVRSDVAIKLYGEDFKTLAETAEAIRQAIADLPGVADLQVERLAGTAQLLIQPDRTRMAQAGVTMGDLRNVLAAANLGEPVTELLEGRRRFTLRVKLPETVRRDPGALANLLVENSAGQRVPLAQLATLTPSTGLEVVQREQGERRILVQCNVRGRDLGSFVQEAEQRIAQRVQLQRGMHLEWGGQFENQQRAMTRLTFVVPLSILLIFFLLMMTFGSVRHALLVMLNVPFALIGGVLALWVRGLYLNVPATIGFVALFGVAVLNGLVLVNAINQRCQQGLPIGEAIRQAAESRLRPVLMTALVALLGFLPMAVSHGAGAEVQRPLATVVIGGLVTSTLLTLVVLPVLYQRFGRSKADATTAAEPA